MDIFIDRLKEERAIHGITQKEMAQRLDIPLRTYINYEQKGTGNRRPDYETLIKIASVLDTSIDYLLGKDDHVR